MHVYKHTYIYSSNNAVSTYLSTDKIPALEVFYKKYLGGSLKGIDLTPSTYQQVNELCSKLIKIH